MKKVLSIILLLSVLSTFGSEGDTKKKVGLQVRGIAVTVDDMLRVVDSYAHLDGEEVVQVLPGQQRLNLKQGAKAVGAHPVCSIVKVWDSRRK